MRMQQRNFSEIVSQPAARGTGTREGGEGTHQENIPALETFPSGWLQEHQHDSHATGTTK